MGTVRILFFASAKESVGLDSIELTVDTPMSFDRLQSDVYAQFTSLLPLKPYLRWAINQRFVSAGDFIVNDGDEAAIIPPVSGG
ncbi:MAG: MoaD/ThiS family protein [Bradymonadia bacterium]